MKILLSFIFIIFSINLYSMSVSPEIGMFINIGASKTFAKTDVGLKKSDKYYYRWGYLQRILRHNKR